MKKSNKRTIKQLKGLKSLSMKHKKKVTDKVIRKHTKKVPKKHTSNKHIPKKVSKKRTKKKSKKQKGGNGEYIEVSGIDIPSNSDLGLSGLSISKMLAKIFDSECNKTKKTNHFMPK